MRWKTLIGTGAACLLTVRVAAAGGQVPDRPATLPERAPAAAAQKAPAPATGAAPAADCGACAPTPCDALVACPPSVNGWVSFEFLYWATQGPNTPPLVTTGPATLPPGTAAVPFRPDTVSLVGGDGGALNGLRPGFRVEAGVYLGADRAWAVSDRFYALGSRSERLVGGSDGTNVVNVPQVVPGGNPTTLYVGYPGLTMGTTAASVQTHFLGNDLELRRALRDDGILRVEAIGGYRYLHLGDSIAASFDAVSTRPADFVPGLPFPRASGEDSARTRNNFHGGHVGLAATGRSGAFLVEVRTSVALGATVSDLDQSRTRVVGPAGQPIVPGQPLVAPVVASASDQLNELAFVPEAGIKVGWQVGDHVLLTAGYDFLYWSRVRRAQELYTAGPALRGDMTDFWAQGLSLGLTLRY